MSKVSMAAACVLLATGWAAVGADSPEPKGGVDPKAAFETLKGLAGEWTGEASGKHASKLVYRVISGGTVVMETIAPGTEHEMVSMYLLDGGELKMIHYCAVGNQPRLKLDAKASTPDKLVFDFEGGANLDPAKDLHIHHAELSLREGGKLEAAFTAHAGGQKADTMTMVLTRQ